MGDKTIVVVSILYVILFFLIIKTIVRKNTRDNIPFIFNVWWFVWLGISFINLGKFFPIKLEVYKYILTGILFINLPFIIFKNSEKMRKFSNIKKNRIIYIIEGIFLVVNIYYLIKLCWMVNIFEDYRQVRLIYFGLAGKEMWLFGNAVIVYMYNFIKSVSIFNFVISLPKVFKEKKYLLFTLSLLNLTLFCFISGGREFVSYIIIFGIFSYKARLLSKSLKYIFILSIPVLLTTFLREGNLLKLKMIIITYFTGSIAYFNETLKLFNGKIYYGELFFSFIIAPIRFLLVALKIDSNKGGMHKVGEQLMQFLQISSENTYSQVYNALASMFYWFYLDFEYLGIILFSFLIGYFGVRLKRKLDKDSLEHLAIISYYEYLLIMSIFTNKFMDIFSIFPLILYFFFIKKIKFRV